MLQRSAFIHGTVFPNLSFLNVLIGRDKKSMPVPMLTFRLWRPLSHDTMEVWSWFLVEKDADEEFKQQSYETYVRTFGISGVFEQDDAETWRSITAGTQGILAGSQTLNFEMGMGVLTSDDTWKGARSSPCPAGTRSVTNANSGVACWSYSPTQAMTPAKPSPNPPNYSRNLGPIQTRSLMRHQAPACLTTTINQVIKDGVPW